MEILDKMGLFLSEELLVLSQTFHQQMPGKTSPFYQACKYEQHLAFVECPKHLHWLCIHSSQRKPKKEFKIKNRRKHFRTDVKSPEHRFLEAFFCCTFYKIFSNITMDKQINLWLNKNMNEGRKKNNYLYMTLCT